VAVSLDQCRERVDIARSGVDDELRVTGLIHVVSLRTPLGPAPFRPPERAHSQGTSTTLPTAWRLSR
jgi:hypothetical protein